MDVFPMNVKEGLFAISVNLSIQFCHLNEFSPGDDSHDKCGGNRRTFTSG